MNIFAKSASQSITRYTGYPPGKRRAIFITSLIVVLSKNVSLRRALCIAVLLYLGLSERLHCKEVFLSRTAMLTGIHSRPRSSQYLPVLEASSPEPSSSSSNRDKTRRRDGKSRQSASSVSGKRRATMNSRDAAYDEDEMLRRAIEESRETGSLGKRTRDDSEEYASAATLVWRGSLTQSSVESQIQNDAGRPRILYRLPKLPPHLLRSIQKRTRLSRPRTVAMWSRGPEVQQPGTHAIKSIVTARKTLRHKELRQQASEMRGLKEDVEMVFNTEQILVLGNHTD